MASKYSGCSVKIINDKETEFNGYSSVDDQNHGFKKAALKAFEEYLDSDDFIKAHHDTIGSEELRIQFRLHEK